MLPLLDLDFDWGPPKVLNRKNEYGGKGEGGEGREEEEKEREN